MRVERHRVDLLHAASGDYLIEENVVGMLPCIDRRARRAGESASVPGKGVDAWIGRTLVRLHLDLMLENVKKLIGIGTGYKNNAVSLIKKVVIDIFEYASLPEYSYQFMVFG